MCYPPQTNIDCINSIILICCDYEGKGERLYLEKQNTSWNKMVVWCRQEVNLCKITTYFYRNESKVKNLSEKG